MIRESLPDNEKPRSVPNGPVVSASLEDFNFSRGSPAVPATADHKLIYRWKRGPKVLYCPFHPHRPGVIRDIARTFLFYCSTECLAAGFRRIAPQHCLPRPKMEDDDLQYCPFYFGSSKGPSVWKTVGHELVYTPRPDDRDCIMAVEVSVVPGKQQYHHHHNPSSSSSHFHHHSKIAMTGPTFDPEVYNPPLREMLSTFGASEQIQMGLALKVLNWNILADIYATEQMYDYCAPWALSWDYRKHLILKQLAALDGDIICLQEVQSDHFEHDLLPAFKAMGFGHVYASKTKAMFTQRYTSEGCLVLYKTQRFQKLEHFVVEFDKHAQDKYSMDQALLGGQAKLSRLNRGNIAVLVLLEDLRHGRRPIGIVNTHITADVDSGDVKLWQAHCLMESVQGWASPMRHGGGLPLVICGDFNSVPDSPVYEFLSSCQVSQSAHQIDDSYGIVGDIVGPQGITHNMPLRSCFVSVVGSEAPFTNYTLKFSGTIDYMWFTPSSMRGIAVSNGYTYDELTRDVALPSPTQPSDHILQVGVFGYV